MNNFYPYVYNPNYMQDLENMRDRIDKQMQQIQAQQGIQQPANVTQNFQLTPNVVNNIKLANSIDEVQKEIVVTDTYFFNNNNTNMWIKNAKGDIRTFDIKEIVPKDEKDILIENLQKQIEALKGGKQHANTSNDEYSNKKSSGK